MRTFFKNIKEHKLAALICLLVLSALIAAAVLVSRPSSSSSEEESSSLPAEESSVPDEKTEEEADASDHFENTDYPVKVTKYEKKIVIELDGSKTHDLKWVSAADPQGVVKVESEGDETEGKLTSVITPVALGYSTVTYTRNTVLSNMTVCAAEIKAEVYVYENEDNELVIGFSDITEDTDSTGSLNADNPYILTSNRLLLPNGGEWTLEQQHTEGIPDGLFVIMNGVDENGVLYFQIRLQPEKLVDKDGNLIKDITKCCLILKNEELGIEKKFYCRSAQAGEIGLIAAED